MALEHVAQHEPIHLSSHLCSTATRKKRLDWDAKGAVVVNDVLAALWMDNGPIAMLSTIHSMHDPSWFIKRLRRRPRIASTNATKVRLVFDDKSRMSLDLPRMVDDYNHHMGGVDIADQLRQYYTTQMRTLRNWFPLFLWLIDTAVIIAYIMKTIFQKNECKRGSHRNYRLELIQQLQEAAFSNETELPFHVTRSGAKRNRTEHQPSEQERATKNRSTQYITNTKYTFDASRFYPGPHLPTRLTGQRDCVYCKFKCREEGGVWTRNRSNITCSHCNMALCFKTERDCYTPYHKEK